MAQEKLQCSLKWRKPFTYWDYWQLAVLCHHTFTYSQDIKIPIWKLTFPLDMANLNMINISSLDFHIWQHLEDHRNKTQLQHLATIPLILVSKIYQYIISGTQHLTPFKSADESKGDTDSIWTLFSHTGIYVTAIGSLIPAGLGIFCCYFFSCWPVRLAFWPLQPGNMQYTILDDDVEAALIYRCDGKPLQPTRPCENHDLTIEHLPTWVESWWKWQMKSLVVSAQGSSENFSRIQGTQKCM